MSVCDLPDMFYGIWLGKGFVQIVPHVTNALGDYHVWLPWLPYAIGAIWDDGLVVTSCAFTSNNDNISSGRLKRVRRKPSDELMTVFQTKAIALTST